MESPNPNQSSPEDLEQLRAQVAALTARVAALERGAGTFSSASTHPHIAREESRVGLTAVNRIGAVTLALGILFFFKYAAENNWIGPLGRVLLGAVAGLAFLAFGERLWRRGGGTLALGITGCGLAILYITAYASSAYYKLLLNGAGLFLMICGSALAVAFALRQKQIALACLGFAGALLAPLTMVGTLPVWLVFPYIVAAEIGTVYVAVRERWALLVPWTAVFAVACGAVLSTGPSWFTSLCVTVAVVHWAARLRAAGSSVVANVLYVVGHVMLLLAGLRFLDLWSSQTSVVLTLASILLGIYGVALLAVGVARGSNVDRATGLALIGLVIAKLYLYDVWQLSYGFRITAFVVLGILLLGASFIYSRWKARV